MHIHGKEKNRQKCGIGYLWGGKFRVDFIFSLRGSPFSNFLHCLLLVLTGKRVSINNIKKFKSFENLPLIHYNHRRKSVLDWKAIRRIGVCVKTNGLLSDRVGSQVGTVGEGVSLWVRKYVLSVLKLLGLWTGRELSWSRTCWHKHGSLSSSPRTHF